MRLDNFLLERHTIALYQEAADWKEAVRLATRLLENAGTVTPAYYQAVLDNHEKNGPYYVVVPSVAMPHAAPDDHVKETGFSLVTLKTPVLFGHAEHDPVDIVLCIAAPDRQSLNEDTIIQVMELIEDNSTIDAIRTARTEEDIRLLLQKVFQ